MILYKIQKWPFVFILTMSMFFLLSCEEVFNEVLGEAVDCAFPHKPQLKGALPDGQVGEPFSGTITASVKNTPYDESFEYGFSVMGSLPEGVEFRIFERTVRFAGTPQEAGTYRFTITVETFDDRDDSEDGSCLGDNTAAEEYEIRIEP